MQRLPVMRIIRQPAHGTSHHTASASRKQLCIYTLYINFRPRRFSRAFAPVKDRTKSVGLYKDSRSMCVSRQHDLEWDMDLKWRKGFVKLSAHMLQVFPTWYGCCCGARHTPLWCNIMFLPRPGVVEWLVLLMSWWPACAECTSGILGVSGPADHYTDDLWSSRSRACVLEVWGSTGCNKLIRQWAGGSIMPLVQNYWCRVVPMRNLPRAHVHVWGDGSFWVSYP